MKKEYQKLFLINCVGRWWDHPQREESLGWEKECAHPVCNMLRWRCFCHKWMKMELRVRHTSLLPVAEGGAMAKTGQRMNDVGRKSGGRRKGRKKGDELDFKVK